MQLRNRVGLGIGLGLLYSVVAYWAASMSHVNHVLVRGLVSAICPAFWVSFVTFVLSSWFPISLSTEAIFLISLAVGGIIGGLIAYLIGRRRGRRSN